MHPGAALNPFRAAGAGKAGAQGEGNASGGVKGRMKKTVLISNAAGLVNSVSPRILKFICIAILLIILAVGLWPFNFFEKNKVAWLSDQDGVRFNGQGIIIGPETSVQGQSPVFPYQSITLEIRLRPLLVTANLPQILALHDGRYPYLFFVGQWKSHLIVRSRTDNPAMLKKGKSYGEIGLVNILLKDRDCFLTITSENGGTAVYIDGRLNRIFPGYHMLSGHAERPVRLVLGSSPSGESSWNGYLTGLALYNRTLSAAEVLRSYEAWTGKAAAALTADDGCLARYTFSERKGTTIHSQLNAGDVLTIPDVFTPVQRKFLYPFWHDFRWNLSLFEDLATNILGFVPLGFFFSLLLQQTAYLHRLRAGATVVILGTLLSLAIELIQAYLPTRDSSLVDVLTNASGTLIGVVSFHFLFRAAGVKISLTKEA
jgi:VanZ family protein